MEPTPFEYHTNRKLNGSYQYVKLSEIVKDFVRESMDDDSLLKNTRRYRIVDSAKAGLRELNKNVINDIRSIQFTIPDNPSFTLPNDFVNSIRVSVLILDEKNNSYRLYPLNGNNDINTAISYLQTNDKELIYDGNGNILAADHLNTYHKPYVRYEFGEDGNGTSKYGDFKIDSRRGKIFFSSDLSNSDVVIEYRSDGLSKSIYEEDEISVHKNAIQVLKDWIFYDLIKYKRGIPQNRINSALLRFKTTRHEAKVDSMKFSLVNLQRTSRSTKTWK
ncbi:hypothetical protein [Wenyingzhuangia sp. 2_MG-2023]|uniref:hypothetical protein n=1 Tax=Wenyingzhuangia sp. 2_MG-2023 TaxID=3062639 RepID=UPI0026E2E07F|nr:hypothetical protein [Wenyingzhuangia sp. 2_MG-2023]MDO6737110.1 hypothetical protein [Wenyingzhuangia sp. 2_MG-2023]